MGGGEVQINTNPRNFTPEVSGYWQGQSQTYSRIPAADMVAMFGNDYYVDTSIVTLNSPDIELDDSIQQEDLDGLQFRIVGVAKSAFPNRRTEGYIDITANKSPGAKIISPAENRFLSVGTSYLVNPSHSARNELSVKPNACMCASPACVDSLPSARPPHGGQGHRIPQAVAHWVKVLYPFRDKKKLGQSLKWQIFRWL